VVYEVAFIAATASDEGSSKKQNPVALLSARGPEPRQLRLARDNRGDGDAQVAKPKGGVSGDGGPFGHRDTTIPAPSYSIVRRYKCAALLRPTLNGGRLAKRALEAEAQCNQK
jgi:hypothetical protein